MEAKQNNTGAERSQCIPKLRFPDFNGDWERKKLESIFSISAGGDIDKNNVSKVKTDIFKYPIYANAEKNKGFYAYSDIYKFDKEVVTVAGRGVNVGIAHARKEKFYPIVRLLVLQPKQEQSIYFFKNSINNLNLFIESTGVPQLTAPQMSSYRVSFPTLPEQQKIADFLTAVDSKLQALKKKKNLLEQYKKGVMQKIFSVEAHGHASQQDNNHASLRFKDNNGKDFPDWEEKKLGEVAEIKTGKKDTQNRIENGEYPFFVRSQTVERINSFSYDGEAILTSGVGKNFHYINGKFDFHQRVYCLNNFFNHVNGKYVFFYFSEHFNKRVMRMSAKNSVDSVRRDMVFDMPIPIPCIKEQTKIANFLSAIDNKITKADTQIEQSEQYKKGLLQQMFV